MVTATSSAFLTDMYEYTMLESALKTGLANTASIFEVFGRRLPAGRRYGVLAGIGRFLEQLNDFRLDQVQLEWMQGRGIISEKTAEFLADFRFTGDIWSYAEGEVFFPYSPLVTVAGTFAECTVLETLLLSVLNHDSAVASAASRITSAAHGRPCLEMGGRRTHEQAAVAAARAAVVAGFSGTSVLEAGYKYQIPTIGTAAHSFTLLYENESEAFKAQIASQGPNTTLLVDTYNVEKGVEAAVKAARDAGGELGAVRIDSGDLVAQAFTVRQQLDALGAKTTKITVTSDLDEYAIAALGAAPVDSYGVGTKLVTGSGVPTAELVYKLVARRGTDGKMHNVAKRSSQKVSHGGLKVAGRLYDATGRATTELVVCCSDRQAALDYLEAQNARPLQVKIVDRGVVNPVYCDEHALAKAVKQHWASRAELPYQAWRLSPGEAGLPTQVVELPEN